MSPAAPPEVVDRAGLDLDRPPPLALGSDEAPTAPEPGRGRLRRLWFVPAGVALLGAAALVPSVGSDGPGAGEARVLVDGVAVVTDVEGDASTVRDDRVDVGPGDQIEITEGRAVFEMAGDVRLEGLGRHQGRDGTTVEMAVAPHLVAGRLLAVAPSPLEIEAGDTTVSIDPSGPTDGAARLDRRLGLGVGAYRGRVTVDSAGRRAEVARFRRVEVAAPGALGSEGLPLIYEADDAWDRRFLGDALVIDAQIAPLLASLGRAERDGFGDPATLRAALPGLPTSTGLADRLEEVGDGGAALVLAAIASVVDDRSFTTAWDRAARFHDEGAPWGLTALDQDVRSSEVLPILRAAFDTVDLQAPTAPTDGDDDTEVAATEAPAGPEGADPEAAGLAGGGDDGSAAASPDPSGAADPGSGGGGGGSGGPSDPGAPPPPASGGSSPPASPPPAPSVPTVPEVVGGVGGTVGGTVDQVTDGVDVIVPGAGSLVDDVVGGLGDVVGGVGPVIGGATGPVAPIVGGLGRTVEALGTGLSTALDEPDGP